VKLTGDHPLVRARLEEDGLFHADAPSLFVKGLADPHPFENFLYATQFILGQPPKILIYRWNQGHYEAAGSLPGLTVPFVYHSDGMYHLYAHGPGINGRLTLVTADSVDGIQWSAPEPVPGFTDISQCESPVSTKLSDRYILFCSRRIGDARQIEAAPPG
jgi:hypothetical protein